MIPDINLPIRRLSKTKRFQEFIFIGDSTNNSVSGAGEQLHNPANNTIFQASVEDSLKITKIETSQEIAHQLKSLQIKTGAVVELINKTKNGSVLLSHNDKLIGMGAKIAHQIVAVKVS